jgi:hypothetical protein
VGPELQTDCKRPARNVPSGDVPRRHTGGAESARHGTLSAALAPGVIVLDKLITQRSRVQIPSPRQSGSRRSETCGFILRAHEVARSKASAPGFSAHASVQAVANLPCARDRLRSPWHRSRERDPLPRLDDDRRRSALAAVPRGGKACRAPGMWRMEWWWPAGSSEPGNGRLSCPVFVLARVRRTVLSGRQAAPSVTVPSPEVTAATARRRSPFISSRFHGASWRTGEPDQSCAGWSLEMRVATPAAR